MSSGGSTSKPGNSATSKPGSSSTTPAGTNHYIFHNMLWHEAWAGPSGYTKCLNLLHDDLGPNPKKLWIIDQSIHYILILNAI